MTPEVCPNCGADVPPRAMACPECGADENTGWSEEAAASNLDLPDDSFDYDEFVKREFEGKSPEKPGKGLWLIVAVVLALLFLILALL